MGCGGSTANAPEGSRATASAWRLPDRPYDARAMGRLETREDFARRRDEFWDTVSAYGGRGECWMALRATCEGSLDEDTAREAVLASGIVSWASDLSVSYDESGQRYELPLFVRTTPNEFAE